MNELKRYHHPDLPLNRSFSSKILIWITQFVLSFIIYYDAARLFRGLEKLPLYSINPNIIPENFPYNFWISLWFAFILIKIFHFLPTLSGILLAEFIIELNFSYNVQYVLLGFLIWSLTILGWQPYKGGEYYHRSELRFQLISYFLILIGFLPILFYGFRFYYSFSPSFSRTIARWYLVLNFFSQLFPILIIHWVSMWIIDRSLIPYFPLNHDDKERITQFKTKSHNFKEQKEAVDNKGDEEDSGIIEEFDELYPHPGEIYFPILTHHSIYNDDHTIVVKIGPVRIYLCTRCTAMIIGAIIGIFLTSFLIFDLDLIYPQNLSLWIGIFLPLLPLTDWGLQALKIRKATTTSRIFTGFALGLSMHFISISNSFPLFAILTVLTYILVFFLLMFFRTHLEIKEEVSEITSSHN